MVPAWGAGLQVRLFVSHGPVPGILKGNDLVNVGVTVGLLCSTYGDPRQTGRRRRGCERGHIRTSVVVVFTWLIAYAMRQPASFQAFTGKTWLFLVLSGLATGLSWLCYFRALQAGPAPRVAPIDKLSVALVILLGALFLGERLTWSKGVGGLLIVAGAITVALE
jgi:transporter family protein